MSEQFQTPTELESSALTWRSILAGAVAAAALTLVLLTIGGALGFSSVSPWSNSGVSARTFQIATGLYLVVTALISSTVGGYLSGRLRTKWKGIHSYEVQFRDTAHGFLAWALATVMGAAVLSGAAAYFVGGAATGAAQGAASNATQTADANYYVAELLRPAANTAASAGANGGSEPAARQQAHVIFAHRLTGEFSNSDRSYLSQLVTAQTGASQADADKRVNDVLAQAKQEADQVRKVTASVSIWLAISMLVGAFAASLAAIEGGQLRDRRWRGVFGTRAYNEAQIEP